MWLLRPGTPWHGDAAPSGPSWRPSFHRNLSIQKPDFSEMKPVREAGQPPPQQMFLAPPLDFPSCCSSSIVSSTTVSQGSLTWRAIPCWGRRDGQPVHDTCCWESNSVEILDPDCTWQYGGPPRRQPPPEGTSNHGGTLAILLLAATSAQLPQQRQHQWH